MNFANMSAAEHRAYIMQAIKNRLDKHNNMRNKCTSAQSDLGSSDDEDSPIRKPTEIENIIDGKAKSIADVLVNDGLNQFYGNLFKQSLLKSNKHPSAKLNFSKMVREPENPLKPSPAFFNGAKQFDPNQIKLDAYKKALASDMNNSINRKMMPSILSNKTLEFSYEEHESELYRNVAS